MKPQFRVQNFMLYKKRESTGDGSVGKVRAFCLGSSLAASNFSLVGIHKSWPAGLNLSTLLGSWRSLANPYFYFFFKKYKNVYWSSSTIVCS